MHSLPLRKAMLQSQTCEAVLWIIIHAIKGWGKDWPRELPWDSYKNQSPMCNKTQIDCHVIFDRIFRRAYWESKLNSSYSFFRKGIFSVIEEILKICIPGGSFLSLGSWAWVLIPDSKYLLIVIPLLNCFCYHQRRDFCLGKWLFIAF